MSKYVYRLGRLTAGDVAAASGVSPDSVTVQHRNAVLGTTIEYDLEVVVERAAPATADERAAWDAALEPLGYAFDREET